MKLIACKKPSRVLAAASLVALMSDASCSAAPSRLAQRAENNGADGIYNFRDEIKETALETANTETPVALALYEFRIASLVKKIEGAHSIETPRATTEGALIDISGDDPYFSLPAVDLPRGVPLWAHLRLKSNQSGNMQLFYWNEAQIGPSEERTASAYVTNQGWQGVMIPLPALGPGTRFRIDPPGDKGSPPVTIASLGFTARVNVATPKWPAVAKLNIAPNTPLQLRSGALLLRHDGKSSGGFTVSIGGQLFARGLTPSLIGYETPRGAQWVDLGKASTRVTRGKRGGSFAIIETTTARDAGGATWTLTREYAPSQRLGGFEVTARVRVSRNRRVVFLPLVMVLPGAGSFGAAKNQALFAGLEYLGKNELSSSDIDITTTERFRRVPLSYKVAVPLMSVQNGGDFLALSWQPQENTAAFFDSPDRTFKGGGHAMGLLMPGAEKSMREDGNPLPYSGALLTANREYSQRATIFGGSGNSVVPAVREYVARKGLPPLPDSGKDEAAYIDLATHGWLDSNIREGALVRHAFWPGFNPSAPADAVVYMEWLAARTRDEAQAARLRESANALQAKLDPKATLYSSVSHVTPPFQPLVLGSVADNARRAATAARDALKQFEAEGIRYLPAKGKTDYARGNGGSRFANGWTASRVYSVLQAAAFSGDRELISQALQKLRALDRYDGDVPRGAQAWELSLHTPDILASANLVHAYALGYELTGDAKMLERARYWAWTGVPFVYLTPPPGKVGLYSTLAVYGGSGWVGSWFGRPVQWNGLVYADALRHLARYDRASPWEKLADGITVSGIQQSWPASDEARQGLLPDFYLLVPQVSDGPAINPGTVQSNAAPLYTDAPLYDFRALRSTGFFVHAPGKIEVESQNARGAVFTVRGWPSETYYVLLSGLPRGAAAPTVTVNGAPFSTAPENYLADEGRLILPLNGTTKISVSKP